MALPRSNACFYRLAALLIALGAAQAVRGDDIVATPATGVVAGPSAEQLNAMSPAMRAHVEEQMKKMGVKPGGGDAKPGESKPEGDKRAGGDEKSKDAGSTETVKRPAKFDGKADAAELKARPDKDGKVQFSFRGQPWTEVLQWFADVSSSSLDWQELPGDYLNLTTTRRYTILETRDLLNRHLLARGFTMLRQGDVLTVAKIDKLDPALVPTVDADELEDYLPHDFVKVRFTIPESIDPAKAAEEVKPLLSPAAKVTPLLASKRLLVIDAVGNLRGLRDMFYEEQSVARQDTRPRVFPIRSRRAEYVADQIMIVLGLDVKKRQSPQEAAMEQQMEQQRMQMEMQMRGGGGQNAAAPKKEEPKVHIAVDRRRNVLLVNAPPPEMAIIERTIKEIDVPASGDVAGLPLSATGDGGTMPLSADGPLTLEKYQTVTASPEGVVNALKEIGNLSPLTQLQPDAGTKTIFAYATAEDHATIKRMIDKLDGAGRGLRVIWLNRRTAADEVAGTIYALMVGEKKKETNNRPYWYYDYGSQQQNQTQEQGFRIQADVENNRLLLWASDSEFAEVGELLAALGAVTSQGEGNPNKVRVLEQRTPEETAELLERLRQTWAGDNELKIHVAPPAQTAPTPEKSKPAANPAADAKEAPVDRTTSLVPRSSLLLVAERVESAAASAAPPVNLTVTPDGKIVISSDDPAALDQLQDLLNELAPPQKKYAVFHLKNAYAGDVALNLEEYFADELAEEEDPFRSWWYGVEQNKDDQATMGKRKKLRFIYDLDTNTIVAQNATASQLATIDELVRIYDHPIDEDAVAKRRTEVIQLKYSRATPIAAALKEVYRDLLSSKDKEFEGRDQNRTGSRNVYYRIGGGDDKQKSSPVKMSFQGALSVGVDEISNTLIISAEENIWESVREIVQRLDEEARPDTVVEVHELRGTLRASELQKVLAASMSKPWPGGKPEADAAAQNNRNGGGDNNGGGRNNNRGNRGRGGNNND